MPPDWNANHTLSYNQLMTTSAAATTVPYYIVPAADVASEPIVDDSAIGWLRAQVSEITELANMA